VSDHGPLNLEVHGLTERAWGHCQ